MGTTSTPNLTLIKPNPYEEEDTWGALLNGNWDKVDALGTVSAKAIAAVTPAADRLAYFTSGTAATVTPFTAFARTILDDADAATARATLGLGGLATLSAVGAAQITDGTVGTAELADAAVTSSKVAANAVTTTQIADGAVTAAKIASGAIPSAFPAGTRLLFQQTAAPTGWTKDTTHDDKALRVVNGAVGTGGSLTFTSAFGSARSISGTTGSTIAAGTVGDTALSISQIPAHDHFIASATSGSGALTNTNYLRQAWDGTTNLDYSLKGFSTAPTIGLSSQTGSGGTHTHSFTGTGHTHSFSTTLDVAVAYVDVIIAVKD